MLPGEIHEFGEGFGPLAVVELPGVLRLLDEGEEPSAVGDILVDVGSGVAESERPHTVGEVLDRGVDGSSGAQVLLLCVELVDVDGDEQASACGTELRRVDVEGCVLAAALACLDAAYYGALTLAGARESERCGCVAAVEQRAELQRRFTVRRVRLAVKLHRERLIN